VVLEGRFTSAPGPCLAQPSGRPAVPLYLVPIAERWGVEELVLLRRNNGSAGDPTEAHFVAAAQRPGGEALHSSEWNAADLNAPTDVRKLGLLEPIPHWSRTVAPPILWSGLAAGVVGGVLAVSCSASYRSSITCPLGAAGLLTGAATAVFGVVIYSLFPGGAPHPPPADPPASPPPASASAGGAR
jgi:hypothetical protein